MNMPLTRSALINMARTHRVPSHTRISSFKRKAQLQPLPLQASAVTPTFSRYLSVSSWLAYPRKDSQDKDSINPEATEYSKSATDDESARQHDAAFDPNMTDPQEQHAKAGEGSGDKSNPLDVSPANPDVSKQRSPQEGGAQNSGENSRPRTSGGSSPKKGSEVA